MYKDILFSILLNSNFEITELLKLRQVNKTFKKIITSNYFNTMYLKNKNLTILLHNIPIVKHKYYAITTKTNKLIIYKLNAFVESDIKNTYRGDVVFYYNLLRDDVHNNIKKNVIKCILINPRKYIVKWI